MRIMPPGMYSELKKTVCDANKELHAHGLAPFTWGNVSQVDREAGVFAIKPSGVPYNELTPEKIVIVSLSDGKVVEAKAEVGEELLNTIIGKFSIGWDVKRISRLNRVIMQLAVYEILYVDDVPEGVAVSEAVRLAKKYNDEMGRFVNGILGAFVRAWKADPNFLENLAAEEAAKIAPAEETEEVTEEAPAAEEI
mgnify:CR=1 FL=1